MQCSNHGTQLNGFVRLTLMDLIELVGLNLNAALGVSHIASQQQS
jgi:hypothetical protein